jgi:hypothetical protein
MKVDKLNLVVLGDVHLGAKNTETVHILKNLKDHLFKDGYLKDKDLVIIEGDFFDRLLILPDPNVTEIKIWVNSFLRLCKKFDVMVRVLEGTPSHDWEQSKMFIEINEMGLIGADIKYFKTLDIEHIDKFGIDILYIPDEWRPETEDVWLDVNKLLNKKDLKQVDFTVMHGAFDYQLPPHVPAPTHVPENYLSITKYFVFVGHVHKFSQYERIIAAGSFDRLKHKEEEDKGFVEAVINKNGSHKITFVTNKNAKIYKTFSCTGKELSEALTFLKEGVSELPDFSHVSVAADRNHPILVNLDELRFLYPTIRFTTKKDDTKEHHGETIIDLKEDYKPINITPKNVGELMLKRLSNKCDDKEFIKDSMSVLNTLI